MTFCKFQNAFHALSKMFLNIKLIFLKTYSFPFATFCKDLLSLYFSQFGSVWEFQVSTVSRHKFKKKGLSVLETGDIALKIF